MCQFTVEEFRLSENNFTAQMCHIQTFGGSYAYVTLMINDSVRSCSGEIMRLDTRLVEGAFLTFDR